MRRALFTMPFLMLAAIAQAQGTGVTFGGLRQDTSAPVEITADSLAVDQEAGSALFSGNVLAVQGELKLAAAEVRVTYIDGGTGIEAIHASGGVTLTNAADAVEGREAVYTLASGELVLTGDVLLTQGASTIAGQRMVLDLQTGTGRVEGRVQTVFTPGSGTATPEAQGN